MTNYDQTIGHGSNGQDLVMVPVPADGPLCMTNVELVMTSPATYCSAGMGGVFFYFFQDCDSDMLGKSVIEMEKYSTYPNTEMGGVFFYFF
jgi:hypothetical protein